VKRNLSYDARWYPPRGQLRIVYLSVSASYRPLSQVIRNPSSFDSLARMALISAHASYFAHAAQFWSFFSIAQARTLQVAQNLERNC
jgi:hypothetical protein